MLVGIVQIIGICLGICIGILGICYMLLSILFNCYNRCYVCGGKIKEVKTIKLSKSREVKKLKCRSCGKIYIELND